jgi:hypothetical protein
MPRTPKATRADLEVLRVVVPQPCTQARQALQGFGQVHHRAAAAHLFGVEHAH